MQTGDIDVTNMRPNERYVSQVISLTKSNVASILRGFVADQLNVGFSYIELLKLYVEKEKHVYSSMNLLISQRSVLVGNKHCLVCWHTHFPSHTAVGFCWIPRSKMAVAVDGLRILGSKHPSLPSSSLRII